MQFLDFSVENDDSSSEDDEESITEEDRKLREQYTEEIEQYIELERNHLSKLLQDFPDGTKLTRKKAR